MKNFHEKWSLLEIIFHKILCLSNKPATAKCLWNSSDDDNITYVNVLFKFLWVHTCIWEVCDMYCLILWPSVHCQSGGWQTGLQNWQVLSHPRAQGRRAGWGTVYPTSPPTLPAIRVALYNQNIIREGNITVLLLMSKWYYILFPV